MRYNLPTILLSENEKIWIKAVYESENDGEEYNYGKIRARTIEQIGTPFDVGEINRIVFNGSRITLFGIAFLDPESPLLSITDQVISTIRELLIQDPNRNTFTAKEVASKIKESEQDVARVFSYMGDLGSFWQSASGAIGDIGCNSVSFGTEEHIEEYLSYESIEKLFERRFEQYREAERECVYDPYPEIASLQGEIEKNTAFIIMAIDPENKILEKSLRTIKSVFKHFDIDAIRVDEIQHSGVITDLVLKKIRESEFIICDLSGERPNVYYEIGYAHALGKTPIIVRQKGTKLHFDLSVHNAPEYKDMKDLRRILSKRLKASLNSRREGSKK